MLSWSVFVLILIVWPAAEYDSTVFTWYDKFGHAFLFGIFSYLLADVIAAEKKTGLMFTALFALIIGVAYSALCEFIQKFVPGRSVSEYDFFSGVIGIVLAVIIFYARYKNKKT